MGRALVTGGAGFIGSHIVDKLLSSGGWFVRVFDNFSSGRVENVSHHLGNPMFEVVRGDLKDLDEVSRALTDVDVVFHFAANPEVRVSAIDPVIHFNENVLGTFNLLEAVRRRDVREIVFASSSSVYGEPDEVPVDEGASVRPVSVYGASKAACENMIHAYCSLYGVRAVVLRYANVVGPRLRHGVVYDFLTKLLRRQDTLEILGDGTQMRSYVYVSDAVEATITAWRKRSRNFEVYNVGSEDWITVDDVAEAVVKALGLTNVTFLHKPVLHGVGWPGDVKKIALRIDKLRNLGWKPKINSKDAVAIAAVDILRELRDAGARTVPKSS